MQMTRRPMKSYGIEYMKSSQTSHPLRDLPNKHPRRVEDPLVNTSPVQNPSQCCAVGPPLLRLPPVLLNPMMISQIWTAKPSLPIVQKVEPTDSPKTWLKRKNYLEIGAGDLSSIIAAQEVETVPPRNILHPFTIPDRICLHLDRRRHVRAMTTITSRRLRDIVSQVYLLTCWRKLHFSHHLVEVVLKTPTPSQKEKQASYRGLLQRSGVDRLSPPSRPCCLRLRSSDPLLVLALVGIWPRVRAPHDHESQDHKVTPVRPPDCIAQGSDGPAAAIF